MNTVPVVPEQESKPPTPALSWGTLVEIIKVSMRAGPKVVKARSYRNDKDCKISTLRCGPLYDVYEKEPDHSHVFALVLVSTEISLITRSEGGQPVLRNIGESSIEVQVPKNVSVPLQMSDGEVVFSDGISDYKVCPCTTDINVF